MSGIQARLDGMGINVNKALKWCDTLPDSEEKKIVINILNSWVGVNKKLIDLELDKGELELEIEDCIDLLDGNEDKNWKPTTELERKLADHIEALWGLQRVNYIYPKMVKLIKDVSNIRCSAQEEAEQIVKEIEDNKNEQ